MTVQQIDPDNMDLIDNRMFHIPCSCYTHAADLYANVELDAILEEEGNNRDYNLLYFNFTTSSPDTLWSRIRMAWEFIKKGSLLFVGIGVSPLNAIKLRDWLNKVIQYYTDRANSVS